MKFSFLIGLSLNSEVLILEENAEHLFNSFTFLNLRSITIQSVKEEIDNENKNEIEIEIENLENNSDENFKIKNSSTGGKYFNNLLDNFNSDCLSRYINSCPEEFNLLEIQLKCRYFHGKKSNTDGNRLLEKGNEKKLKNKSEKVKKNQFESSQGPYCSLLLQECTHMNRLISRINSDLNLITRSLSGLNDVTEDLENIMMCLGTVLYVHTSAVCAKIKLNF